MNLVQIKDKFEGSVSLISWAYNEEELIKEFLERAVFLLDSTVKDYEIVLIDDGSTDKTYEIAKAFQDKNPRLKIYRNERNFNVGISCRRAIQRASKEFIFWQTVDWSYDISNLRIFLEYLKQYDLIQGVRISPIGGIVKLFGMENLIHRSDTIPKAIVSVVNYIIIRFLFRIPLSDFQNVILVRTHLIQSLNLESNSSFINPECKIKLYWKGVSIKEVPIGFIPRAKGEAKGTKPRAIYNAVNDIFRLWFKWVILGKCEFVKKGKIDRVK